MHIQQILKQSISEQIAYNIALNKLYFASGVPRLLKCDCKTPTIAHCIYLFFIAADSQLRFLYKPQNKSAHLNDNNVYLLCVATGNVSSYIWLKDGVSIHDSGIEYQLTAGGSILDFTSITDKVQGVYTCVVRSETNQTINSMAWIQILSKF